MNFLSKTVLAGSVLGLAGCGTFTAEPFMNSTVEGDDFNAHLARFYQEETKVAGKEVNWPLAGAYAEKGRMAAAGNTPEPWTSEQFDGQHNYVTNNDKADMIAKIEGARAQLMDALASNRDSNPEACAKAQVMFDRHVVDEAYTKNDVEPAEHYKIFEEALAECGGAAIAAIDAYTIYFGFDRYNLTDAAKRVINNVAGMTNGRGVNVYGYTDTAGPASYNEGLSKRRADSVAKALRDAGVQVVAEIPEGETNLAVDTGDGVAEPLNRRAIVKFR